MPTIVASIIVPTYKEAENIPILARRLFAALSAAGYAGELILVDDNSQDGTEQAVCALAQEFPIRLISRRQERGLSSAVLRGFREAKHDVLVCMDADLSHPPEAVPTLIQSIASGQAEFALGSRYVAGGRTTEEWGLLRRINSWGATLLARPLTAVRDPMAGFFALRRDVLDRAQTAGLSPIGYKIGLEILIKSGCGAPKEVPIAFSDRIHGKSKLTTRQQVQYLRHLGRLYRFRYPHLPAIALASAVCIAAGLLLLLRHR